MIILDTFLYCFTGFSIPSLSKPETRTSVECASKIIPSLMNSESPTSKFNAIEYDHQTKTCVLGNISPFSANFDTASKIKRSDVTTGSIYTIPSCLPKREFDIYCQYTK